MVVDINQYRKERDLTKYASETMERLEQTSAAIHQLIREHVDSLAKGDEKRLHTLIRFIKMNEGDIWGWPPRDLDEMLKSLLAGEIQIRARGITLLVVLLYLVVHVLSSECPQIITYEFRKGLSQFMNNVITTTEEEVDYSDTLREFGTMTDHAVTHVKIMDEWVDAIV